jgi:hypothetical protein
MMHEAEAVCNTPAPQNHSRDERPLFTIYTAACCEKSKVNQMLRVGHMLQGLADISCARIQIIACGGTRARCAADRRRLVSTSGGDSDGCHKLLQALHDDFVVRPRLLG